MSNNMPPKDLSAADLWAEITAMPRPHRVVDLPRTGVDGRPVGKVALFVLTQEEVMSATANTERFVRKVMKADGGAMPQNGEASIGYSTLFENRASEEVLFRACKRPEDLSRSFFPTVEAIGRSFSTDEIGVLIREYNRVQSELGPITSKMGKEEVDAWIEKLATGGSSSPLSYLSTVALNQLIMSMAALLWSSQTAKSSHGSLPEEST